MNKTLWQYYVDAAADISDRALADIATLDQWQRERPRRREEFLRSMGLHDVPACDLAVTCHGEFAGPGYRAFRMAYQILPDVWGTGNLLLPDPLPARLVPAVLHPCGHSASAVGDTSSSTLAWARRGYACFVFDTLTQTDNIGSHRGLASGRRMDWIARGYTSAGGELLNGLRAFELLHARPEVDPGRIGVTGRSGGGAQSFFLAVAEERIAAAVPVVGVASLKWTLAERAFRGHCDCMYAQGLFQRDAADFAALIAPRPLLLCYGIDDGLYSPAEYHGLVEKARRIYRLHGCEDQCRLLEFPGGHGEREPAATETFRWFDAHVAGESRPVAPFGKPEIGEPQGSVFNGRRPVPDRVDLLPELLTVAQGHPLPRVAAEWPAIREAAVARLRENVFGWLERTGEAAAFTHLCHNRYRGEMGGMEAWLELPEGQGRPQRLILAVCDTGQTAGEVALETAAEFPGEAVARLEPRATGVNGPPSGEAFREVQRAGALVGLTLPLLWMNDLRHAIACLRRRPGWAETPVYLYGRGDAAVACLYYAILHEEIAGVFLIAPPASHLEGGSLPGILREMDLAVAVGLMAPRPVGIVGANRLSDWYALRWGHRVYHRMGIPERHALGRIVGEVRETVLADTCKAEG
jgi:dienelactone hydrolase